MKLYCKDENFSLFQGNMLDMLEVISFNSIDSIVTDPPYGFTSITKRFGKKNSAPAKFSENGAFVRLSKGFMGKEWDGSGIEYNVESWKKCYDVLKEGGYLLAFGGSRTYHKIAKAIEDAGFEIRDCIMWLYGSGFPKSMNISKKIATTKKFTELSKFQTELSNQWNGWGTCLKPAYEPIIVARKPFKGTLIENVIKNGVGGLNIDECRVKSNKISKNSGRFPSNVILTFEESDYDEVCSGFPNGKKNGSITKKYDMNNQVYGKYGKCNIFKAYDDEGSASRYFYCAKASKKDREEGLDSEMGMDKECFNMKNIHPTVKPTELMQYLIRLVTPKGGIILDPFMGSGSTGKSVMYENNERNSNYKFIGIEITDEYLPIAVLRIKYAKNKLKEKEENIDITKK